MKEIDLKTIEALIKSELDIFNIKYIVAFVTINLIIAIINWLIQKNLKNLEKSIYKKKIREDRRISIIEELYKELVSFTHILDEDSLAKEFDKVAVLEKKLSENRLYINSDMNSHITAFIDYVKSLANNFVNKDFKKEKTLLSAIEKEFNK